ncbi:DUF1566 domain-containing protein [Flavobacteriaceae bacterium]|nr:DUF1566 domain-containing protein [Flavobacteriaceae bacterium]MDA9028835.1 DUF1566 domain-containing protein [Flavobacteriaceae bacterium]
MKQFFTLLAAVLLTATTYAQIGINNENPDASAALDITSTTGGLLPPRMTTTQRDAISAAKGLVLFNTTTNTLQINEGDATTANWVSLTASTCGLSIGDTHQGGIIFYLDGSGCHGLVAAPSDQSTGIQWYNGNYIETRAYGSGLFEGKYNTVMINNTKGGASSAAGICGNLSLGGYNDWYLPSIEELNKMYQNIGQGNTLGLGNVGNFANNYYCCSTEYVFSYAWWQDFSNGFQYFTNLLTTYNVRAVRAF